MIGFDVMGVFVNAENPVEGLTRTELKEIFTGRVTNWKEFSGPNWTITVFSEELSGGRATIRAFRDMVLGGDPYGPVKEREDATDCVREVAANKGGITASSMSFAIPGVRALTVEWLGADERRGPARRISSQAASHPRDQRCSRRGHQRVFRLHAHIRSAGDHWQELRPSQIVRLS